MKHHSVTSCSNGPTCKACSDETVVVLYGLGFNFKFVGSSLVLHLLNTYLVFILMMDGDHQVALLRVALHQIQVIEFVVTGIHSSCNLIGRQGERLRP